MKKKLSILMLMLFATATLAQDDPLRMLLNSKDLECEFYKGHLSEWREGKVTTEDLDEKINLHFVEINIPAKVAKMIGNNFSSNVTTFATQSGVTFLEVTPSGNVTLTTVFPHLNGTGNFTAVFSRHIFAEVAPIVSQWQGECHRLAPQVQETPQ